MPVLSVAIMAMMVDDESVQSLPTAIDYAAYPRIPRSALRMRWIDDYHDGPLSGMLLFEGRSRWFECCNFSLSGEERRRYLVRDLTDEQIAEEEKWNALFVEHVGDHWLEHEDGLRHGNAKPGEGHAKYYEAAAKREPRDYSACPILGWFEGYYTE